jgi:hypothetical protein
VVYPASSTFFFYFVGEPFFATLKQKWDFFCYPAAKMTRVSTGTRGWEIKSQYYPTLRLDVRIGGLGIALG